MGYYIMKRKYKIYEKINIWNIINSFDADDIRYFDHECTDITKTEHFEIVENTPQEKPVITVYSFSDVRKFIDEKDDISLYEEIHI